MEYMTYPRGCALAEVFWSPPVGRDYAEFEPRLKEHVRRLRVLDVAFRPLLPEPEPVGTWTVEAGKGEAVCEWELVAAPEGACVIAFTPPHHGLRFEAADVSVVANGETLCVVASMKPTDPHFRGCEAAVELPAAVGPRKLKATIRVEHGEDVTGEAFLFSDAGR